MIGALEQFNSKRISGWVSLPINESKKIYYRIGNEEFKLLPLKKGERKDLNPDHLVFKIDVDLNECTSITIQDEKGLNLLGTPKKITASASEKNKVMQGKQDWLYLANDTNRYMDYFLGLSKIKPEVLDSWKQLEITRRMICSYASIEYLSIIVPEKCSVYPQFLPSEFSRESSALIEQFKHTPILSDMLIPSFPENTDLYNTYDPDPYFYYKGDTHWNNFGAYHAFIQIMKRLNISNIVKLNDFITTKNFMSGDLRSKLDAANIELVRHIKPKTNKVIELFRNNKITTGRVESYLNENALVEKSLVVFHTSSIDWMKHFILAQFQQVTFVWSKKIDWNIVRKLNPDSVIYQTNERFMTSSTKDVPAVKIGESNAYIANKLIEQNSKAFSMFGKNHEDFFSADYYTYPILEKSVLKIILKAKNEAELIDSWIEHHAKIVGYENLIIIDTGSDDPEYIRKLNAYNDKILILSYTKSYDLIHANKAPANKEFYELLEKTSDKITILDADEFMFFYDGVNLTDKYDPEKFPNETILCGTWLNNASLPTTSKFSLKDQEIKVYVDEGKVKHGTKTGKSIVPTRVLSHIDHVGHNLSSKFNSKYINNESFGRVYIVHFNNLGEQLTKKRVSSHLLGLGVSDDILKSSKSETEVLEKVDNTSPKALNYIKQYFERHHFDQQESISLDLSNPEVGSYQTRVQSLSENIKKWGLSGLNDLIENN